MRALRPLLLSLALATPAAAQSVKPRILLVFDTSGSMGFNLSTGAATGGDGSIEYPGTGLSRLFVAKEVIRRVVETTSEVDFALARYPQAEGLDLNDGTGRDLFTAYDGLATNPLNYVGYCGGDLRPGAQGRPFSYVVPFGADNEPEILSWLDHREDWPDDPELRAEGPTPLAESLRLGEQVFRETYPEDEALRCRRNYVVLLTDGAESCVSADRTEAALSERIRTLRTLGQTFGAPADNPGVRTFVVAFAVDPAQMGLLDRMARLGGTAIREDGTVDNLTGRAHQATDEASLRLAFARVIAEAIPTERCNGLDDDCDGQVDEGVRNACGRCGEPPVEICNGVDDDCDGLLDEGVRNACGACGEVPAERCNGVDDDCDGQVDEDVQNACGGCAAVSAEVCDGRDNDCDGRVDNIPDTDQPLSRPCSQDVGACRAGRVVCQDGAFAACDGVLPTEERCNGKDDDCDGQTDELTVPCGPLALGEVGQCHLGLRACAYTACETDPQSCDDQGFSQICVGAVDPSEEVCDGLDNDCDGEADEGLINACGGCGVSPPEICNGEDDNCDGRVDDGAACPRGYLCSLGECVPECDQTGECGGEQSCLSLWPEGRFCFEDRCAHAACPAGLRCDAEAGGCVDPCADVDCPEGFACELGGCVARTCRHDGCGEGERCVNDACEVDPCAGVSCADREFCREGGCVAACIGQACGEGLTCRDGECVADPCGGRCLRGQRCDPEDGLCVEDPCARVVCPAGQACQAGACRADAPCAYLDCPGSTRCVDGTCTDQTPGVEPDLTGEPLPALDSGVDGGEVDGGEPDARPLDASAHDAAPADGTPDSASGGLAANGGEGCGCELGGGPRTQGLWLFALGLAALFTRRRR